jgi:pre-mRNA-splicing factor SYF1
MEVYDRACSAMELAGKAEMYSIYANRCAELFGVAKTREVFDKAIAAVPDDDVCELCKKYAHVEKELGETDRARAVYMYGSQFVDPRVSPEYWGEWHAFELECGNADTFREMLRVQRSVRTAFSFKNLGANPEKIAQKMGADSKRRQSSKAKAAANSMEALELSSIDRVEEERKQTEEADKEEAKRLENPDEIDLDDLLGDDDDEDEGDGALGLELGRGDDFPSSSVPDSLYGGV